MSCQCLYMRVQEYSWVCAYTCVFINNHPLIGRFLFRSGNQEHPGDKIKNTTVEILPFSVNKRHTSSIRFIQFPLNVQASPGVTGLSESKRRLTGISGVGLLCTRSPGLSLVHRRLSYRGNETAYCHPAVIQRLKTFEWALMFVLEDIPRINKWGW